jgi:putative flippase GtrA
LRARALARYHALPENLRIVLTAALGAMTGMVTYELVYLVDPFEPRATTAWTASFLINVARQHSFHRVLTFTHPTPYWSSLARAYVMYTGSLVLGAGLNWLLTQKLGVNHRVAWFCCLMNTAVISLFFLKRFVFRARRTAEPGT